MRMGAGDDGLAGFQGLTETVQHLTRKLRQLVEKEDAPVGERNLAGLHAEAAADQGRHGGRMMRRAIGPAAGNARAVELARKRGDHRGFEHFAGAEGRENARQAGGEHGLAGAGRAHHQHVVAAGGGMNPFVQQPSPPNGGLL